MFVAGIDAHATYLVVPRVGNDGAPSPLDQRVAAVARQEYSALLNPGG